MSQTRPPSSGGFQESGEQMSPWATDSIPFTAWPDAHQFLDPPADFQEGLRSHSLPHSESDALIHAIADDIMNEGIDEIVGSQMQQLMHALPGIDQPSDVPSCRSFDMQRRWPESFANQQTVMPPEGFANQQTVMPPEGFVNQQTVMPPYLRPMDTPFGTSHEAMAPAPQMQAGERFAHPGSYNRPSGGFSSFNWPQMSPTLPESLATPQLHTSASHHSEPFSAPESPAWRVSENLGQVASFGMPRIPSAQAGLGGPRESSSLETTSPLHDQSSMRRKGKKFPKSKETSTQLPTRPSNSSVEGSTGIIIGRWQPQKNTIYPRTQSAGPKLSEQERRKQLLPSLEVEEPTSSGALDVALAQAGNLADQTFDFASADYSRTFSRRKLKYRIRSNALERQRSLSEPPPPGKRGKTEGADSLEQQLQAAQALGFSEEAGKSVGFGSKASGQQAASLPSSSSAPVVLGPNDLVVDAVKLAAFLDQLNTIQAKLQHIQLERDAASLQFATVRKATNLLEEAVSGLDEMQTEEGSSRQQTQLKEKAQEISALLSTVSAEPDPLIMLGLRDALERRSAELRASSSRSDSQRQPISHRESASDLHPSLRQEPSVTLAPSVGVYEPSVTRGPSSGGNMSESMEEAAGLPSKPDLDEQSSPKRRV